MSNLVPISVREGFDGLRDRVLDTMDRWLPRRRQTSIEPLDSGIFPGFLSDQWLSNGLFGGPQIEVEDTDEALLVTAELPGLDERDFQVELEGERLILRGEKQASREERSRNKTFTERRYGSFYRAIPLNCEIDKDKADAKYKQGVLRITLPKTEAEKARRVQVKVN
jgi:HSP20 family protein